MTDLTKLTLAEARKGLGAKSFSSAELTDAYLQAIEAANPKVRGFDGGVRSQVEYLYELAAG